MTQAEAVAAIFRAIAWQDRVERVRAIVLSVLLGIAVACVATDRFSLAALAILAFSLADMTAQSLLIALRPDAAAAFLRRNHARHH